jgi:hypothetical protein
MDLGYVNDENPCSSISSALRHYRLAATALCAALVVLFGWGFTLGRRAARFERYAEFSPPEQAERFRVFWEGWACIEQQLYPVDPLDLRAMTCSAIPERDPPIAATKGVDAGYRNSAV